MTTGRINQVAIAPTPHRGAKATRNRRRRRKPTNDGASVRHDCERCSAFAEQATFFGAHLRPNIAVAGRSAHRTTPVGESPQGSLSDRHTYLQVRVPLTGPNFDGQSSSYTTLHTCSTLLVRTSYRRAVSWPENVGDPKGHSRHSRPGCPPIAHIVHIIRRHAERDHLSPHIIRGKMLLY